MAFDLARIRQELQAAPLASPYPIELSAAVVSDVFRMAHLLPPRAGWWRERKAKGALFAEQAGMLAHLLATTSLRAESVLALGPQVDAQRVLDGFFASVEPLTAEMIRANAFRQEEFLRKWAAAVGGGIAGETAAASKQRREQLDYRRTLAEYSRAEKARQQEAARRAKMLQEAARREAEARGWRE
jgi:hypothetical protein